MREIVIVGAARTPIGSFQGSLATAPATRLGSIAIAGALQRAGIEPEAVGEVAMGNVLSAGVGQAPARQAALGAGLPPTTHAVTINKVCGSGMMAIIHGVRSLLLGDCELVVAGGMESMSLAPYLSPGARAGLRMGHHQLIDSMVYDGLWDPYQDRHMGELGELCARKYKFSREEQDAFAIESFRRAQAAQEAGKFDAECVPVEVRVGRETTQVLRDEGPPRARFDKMTTLRPAFDPEGTITAANASTINDGAAAVALTTREHCDRRGLTPRARIVAYALASQEPQWFTTAPVAALRAVLNKAGWQAGDVDLYEVNEAFAVVAMAAQRELGIDHARLNVRGGSIALGHPIGASGARIVVTLLAAMEELGARRGVATLCIGGGEATALAVERI